MKILSHYTFYAERHLQYNSRINEYHSALVLVNCVLITENTEASFLKSITRFDNCCMCRSFEWR